MAKMYEMTNGTPMHSLSYILQLLPGPKNARGDMEINDRRAYKDLKLNLIWVSYIQIEFSNQH